MKLLRRVLALVAFVSVAAQPVAAQSYVGAPASSALGAFGGAVAVVGDHVLIGEPNNSLRPGMVYVYSRDAMGAWTETGVLTAPDAEAEDGFGASLAADGDEVLVGARGTVHVFEHSGNDFIHTGSFSAAAVEDEDAFGASVALSGDWALVGAPARADQAGAAWLFQRGATGWNEVEMLDMGDGEGDAFFGISVALSGAEAYVGVAGYDARAGAVAVYALSAEGAERTALLEAGDGSTGARFGSAVTVQGDRLAVGAPAFGGGMGTVYTFDRDAEGAWTQSSRVLPFDGPARAGFGSAVVLNGASTWVGAPGSGDTGAAYLYWDEGTRSGALRIAPEEGSTFAGTMAVSGDVAVFGLPRADYGAGQAAIYTGATDGSWSEAARVMSEVESYQAVRGGEVRCADGRATAFDCSEVDLVAFMPVADMGGSRGVNTNDVWGWTDPETGKEWAIVGMRDATSFVDVSDPANPVYVGKLPMTEGARANAWRDMKVFDNHVFVVADGAGDHGVQIFDLTRLRDFDGTPEIFDEDAIYDGVASSHNIVINESTGMAYAVGSRMGGETCGGGLHMIDVNEPLNPTFAGCFADPQTGRASTGYSHDAQCVTYHGPDEDFVGREICLGSNETALSIADVTDRDNPVAVSRASYPNFGYSHQGWLSDDHRYFFMNDELDEIQGKVDGTRTLIWDLAELADPQLIAEHIGVEKSSDHNLYIVGDRMYQSNYQSGLRILDISDPANPREVGFFDTVPHGENAPGFGGSWSNYPFFESGVVIVTSGNEGLFILRPADQRTIS